VLILLGVLLLSFLAASTAEAGTHTWQSTSDPTWSNAANWNGGVPTSGEAGGTILTFPAGASLQHATTNDIAGLVIDQINLNDTGYSLAGNGIALGTAVTPNIADPTGGNTLALPVALTAGETINVAGGTLTLSGILSGSGGLSKTGAGSLALTGANTYSGGTTLSAGTLILGNDTAVGTGALQLSSGTLRASTAVTIPNAFTAAGATIGGTSNITLSGAGSLSGTTTILNSGTTTLSGALAGCCNLTIFGGTVVMNGSNTYTGNTELGSGSLMLGNDNALGQSILILRGGTLQGTTALTLNNSVSVFYRGVIGGSNDIDFTGNFFSNCPGFCDISNSLIVLNTARTRIFGPPSGSGYIFLDAADGEMTISGDNNGYYGYIVVNAGVLTVGHNNALGSRYFDLNGGTLKSSTAVTLPIYLTIASSSTIGGSHDITFTNGGRIGIYPGEILTVTNTATTTLAGPMVVAEPY
jgi:fibronectin-binding autotransporter adhesin